MKLPDDWAEKVCADMDNHTPVSTALVAIAIMVCAFGMGFVFTGCSGGTQFRVQTPYGTYDPSTSGTIDLDLRPYLPPPPPPKDYTPQTLEK